MNDKSRQLKILSDLLAKGAVTRYGKRYHFENISSYLEFANRVPVHSYADIEDEIREIKSGKKDILWPGYITKFAVSSGTTGKGKHLPLSSERIKSDQRFMRLLCMHYFRQRPNILNVFGKHLSLPGTVERHGDISVGEISGFTARRAPWWVQPFQVQNPAHLTRLSFDEKFEQVLHASLHANIKVIVAVPGWILTLFQKILDKTGAESMAGIWPDLKLLICGGVKLSNYRSHLENLTGDLKIDFIETYGSSEGYFAFTDNLKRDDLRLVCDNGIFMEFIPGPLHDPESLNSQPAVPLWEVETGRPYAMVVTTNAGLWRYAVKDIVEFTTLQPPRIRVKGRLNEMLDEFGEAVYLFEAEEVLKKVTGSAGLDIGSFTVGGQIKSDKESPRHYWFIQFFEPADTAALRKLADAIDRELQQINRHYAIRRESGTLASPKIKSINQTDINRWHEFRGTQKAQNKLPKFLRSDEDLDFFLKV